VLDQRSDMIDAGKSGLLGGEPVMLSEVAG